MRIQTFPGGWYVDALPNGSYVALITNSHIETSRGRVELPHGQNVLQLRMARDGVRFAGTGHVDGHAWEWTGSAWEDRGVAFGNRACIYTADGNLRVVRKAGEETGSLGFRYVDDAGRLIPSWETYDSTTERARQLGITQFWEWTEHSGVVVGQGETGVVAEFEGKRRVAEGRTTFINFNVDGVSDSASIAWVQEDRGEARIAWLTGQEFGSLPLVGEPPPDEEDDPPVEESMVLPMHVQNAVNDLYALHVDLAEGNDDQRRELTKMIAEQARFVAGERWGWKSQHASLESPSKDAIAFLTEPSLRFKEPQRMFVFDLFDGTTRKPNQFPSGEKVEQYFIPVEAIDHLGDGEPDDEDEDEPDTELEARVAELERRLALVPTRVEEVIAEHIKGLKFKVVADAAAEPISTSRAWSHTHSLRLTIVRE